MGHALIDTHCHIHDDEFDLLAPEVLERARENNIVHMICVGTDVRSSLQAMEFCADKDDCSFALALHPHEAKDMSEDQLRMAFASIETAALQNADNPSFVAIGECGLDYYYHDDQEVLEKQQMLLRLHLELAKKLKKPVIFHVREAFEDFWPIYDEYDLPGVVHSFSSGVTEVEQILERKKLYIGLNGIMTFTKDENQTSAAKLIPLSRLMLETDAPFLTPVPLRGKINEPTHVRLVAEYLSDLRGEAVSLLADQTTTNARSLFGI